MNFPFNPLFVQKLCDEVATSDKYTSKRMKTRLARPGQCGGGPGQCGGGRLRGVYWTYQQYKMTRTKK